MLHRTHARQPTNINNDLRISRLKFLNNEEMEKKHKFLYDNDDFVNNFSFFFTVSKVFHSFGGSLFYVGTFLNF